MTRIVKLDPKGNIPSFAINLGIKKAGDATVKLIELIQKTSKTWKKVEEENPKKTNEKPKIDVAQSAPSVVSKPIEKKIEQINDVDDSDDENQFFDTSSYFEIPDSVLDEKITPLQQRLLLVENNTLEASKKIENVLKKTKKFQSSGRSRTLVSFSNLTLLTKLFIVLWPIIVLGMFNIFKKWTRKTRK